MVKTHMEQHFGDGYHIRVCKVRKNNGLYKTGLNIVKEGKSTVPAIYLEFYLEEYKKGRDLEEIYLDIISEYERHKDDVSFDLTILTEFEKVRERICLKLINLEKNSEMLEEMPHVIFQDLAAVILYPGVLKDFTDRTGRDVYILLSSIHETIFTAVRKTV